MASCDASTSSHQHQQEEEDWASYDYKNEWGGALEKVVKTAWPQGVMVCLVYHSFTFQSLKERLGDS